MALKIPSSEPYDYLIPLDFCDRIVTGARVVVPLQNRFLCGVVVSLHSTPPKTNKKIVFKEVAALIDEDSKFSDFMLSFTRWVAEYYWVSWGEVLHAAIPGGLQTKIKKTLGLNVQHEKFSELSLSEQEFLRKMQESGLSKKEEAKLLPYLCSGIAYWQITAARNTKKNFNYSLDADKSIAYRPRSKSKSEKVFRLLQEHKVLAREDLLSCLPDTQEALRRLIKQGIILQKETSFPSSQPLVSPYEITPKLLLTDEQEKAFFRIMDSLSRKVQQVFLLQGVTGSGKTELYLQTSEFVLSEKKSVIILIPEIALTPQTVRRFQERFRHSVFIQHSAMKPNERLSNWEGAARAEYCVVIGARSAIFTPVKRLGLIIVDEEHDPSYKQQESPCYNARDLAVKRSKDENCVAVLGSATPSIESTYNCVLGKYERLKLTKRATLQPVPTSRIISLRHEERIPGVYYMTRVLFEGLRDNYAHGRQSIVFLNRRGYASFLFCPTCDKPVLCPNCSIPPTWHKYEEKILCHYCNFRQAKPKNCPICKKPGIKEEGIGTQRVECDLSLLFPQAKVLRLDQDALQKKSQLETVLKKIHEGDADFIVGTQLLSKGHDFPNIGCVAILLGDTALNIMDFRASERAYQLYSQVSGRSGRLEGQTGVTYLQTYNPEHPIIKMAANNAYKEFYVYEIEKRKFLQEPPIVRSILIQMSHENEASCRRGASNLEKHLNAVFTGTPVTLVKAHPSPLYRINKRYYWRIILKSTQHSLLRHYGKKPLHPQILRKFICGSRILINVDPL